MQETDAINALKEIRVRIDAANREYDDMSVVIQMRHGEEVWLSCVEDIRGIVNSRIPQETT